jgi:acetyl-CoA decarbonylase/synthase complex subunit gamma
MARNMTPLTVYRYLPKTNCGECEQKTCMAFASALIDRKVKVEDCPPILESKYGKEKRPPVREVFIGTPDVGVTVGGEEVVRRHELTYYNKTALAVEVSDELEPEKISKRARAVASVEFERVGDILRLDMIAVRCASGDPERFAEAARLCAEAGLPLILCALEPAEFGRALKEVGQKRPLLYAAAGENWEEMAALAVEHDCPLVVSAPSLEELAEITSKVRSAGVKDIVLDPGTRPYSGGVGATIGSMTKLRIAAVEDDQEIVGYPLMGVPAVVWMDEGEEAENALKEAIVTASLIGRYADLLILKTMRPWAHLSVMTLRQNIYTDPRKPVAVDDGMREYGPPNASSPLLLTTNFALTFYTVENDVQSAGVKCYVLVVNTEGIGVQSSVAGGQLDAGKVAEAIEKSGVKDKLDHNVLVIPGMAARLKGDIEDATGMEVIVGPRDSSSIPAFLEKKWKKK